VYCSAGISSNVTALCVPHGRERDYLGRAKYAHKPTGNKHLPLKGWTLGLTEQDLTPMTVFNLLGLCGMASVEPPFNRSRPLRLGQTILELFEIGIPFPISGVAFRWNMFPSGRGWVLRNLTNKKFVHA